MKLKKKLHVLIVDIWAKEQVPQSWEHANLIPISKKGSGKECGNYRGISLLELMKRYWHE